MEGQEPSDTLQEEGCEKEVEDDKDRMESSKDLDVDDGVMDLMDKGMEKFDREPELNNFSLTPQKDEGLVINEVQRRSDHWSSIMKKLEKEMQEEWERKSQGD